MPGPGTDVAVYADSVARAPLVDPIPALTPAERARTQRHLVLQGIGDLGQRRLAAARIAVVGAGGLGSPVVMALAAAGVGGLTVIDDDDVDLSNLQRQLLHRHADIGTAKTSSAVRVAADLSPETVVTAVRERLTAGNAARLLADVDLVVDGSDTFATRTAVAAACESRGIPLVWGVVQEFHAQVTVFWSAPPAGIEPVRLSDLHPADAAGEPPTCAEVGVLGSLCLQVGGILATEAIKLVLGIGEPLLGRVLVIDALRATQTAVPLRAAAERTPTPARPEPAPVAADEIRELTASEMLSAQDAGATLLDVREPWETQSGVVTGSVLLPLGDLLDDPGRVEDDRVVVICAHGIRARRAAEVLRARGVTADILVGGLAAWQRA